MATQTTYSSARGNFAGLWNEVENSREPAILQRRGHEAMALIPARDLSSLQETAYLLRSPGNAVRLLTALARSRGESGQPAELELLARQLGLSGETSE